VPVRQVFQPPLPAHGVLRHQPVSLHSGRTAPNLSAFRNILVIMSIHVLVNDCTPVKMWQDVSMSQQLEDDRADPGTAGPAGQGDADQAGGPPSVREVSDVAVIKALADPTRLAILNALMVNGPGTLPVRSVKELAEELGEPQTKLYRHVKQLEAARLIEVAATRVVSGILEQRYQASQRDLTIHQPGLLRDPARADEVEAAARNVLSRFSGQFFEAYRDGRIGDQEGPGQVPSRRPVMMLSECRVSPERAAAIRAKLGEVMAELNQPSDPDGVPVHAFIGFFSPAEAGPA
jgi:DNA-binding transcriptional ArsR family regulator